MPDRLLFDVRSSFVSVGGRSGTILLCLAFQEKSNVDSSGAGRTTDPRCVSLVLPESRIGKGGPPKGARIVAAEVPSEEDSGREPDRGEGIIASDLFLVTFCLAKLDVSRPFVTIRCSLATEARAGPERSTV